MDVTTLFAGPAGAAFGFFGSLLQKGLGIWEARQAHKQKMEELEVMSRIDLQKADILLRQTQEDRAGEAFTEAIKAQADLRPAHPWAKTVLALFRPGLTLYLMIASTGLAILFQPNKPELLDYIIVSMFSMSSVALGYWFGVRTQEKVQITQAFPRK